MRAPHVVLTLAIILICFAQSTRGAEPPANVAFTPDIVYGQVGGDALKLNLSLPKNATGKLPCVVVIHGGAWRAGDRSAHNDLTWHFAQQGYVAATVGYRFCPRHVFPAQVQDVKCAVRFLRANAEKYHVDPDRIGAVGFSAGAHLAMMLGTMDAADGLDDSGPTASARRCRRSSRSSARPTSSWRCPSRRGRSCATFLAGRSTRSPTRTAGRRR